MSGKETSEERLVREVYAFAAKEMKNGRKPEEIRALLTQQGLDEGSAAAVVENLSKARSRAVREAAQKDMLYGALWCIGGLIVTAATYGAASSGGSYVVAWGAIIFGAVQFFRGLAAAGGE